LFDPAMERSNRLTDFLVGGAGTTTLGGLAKGAVGASRATQTRQNAATMKRMSDMFSLETAGMGIDAELGAKAINLGTAVFNQAEQSKRAAQQIAANKSTAMLNAEIEEIKLEYKSASDAEKNEINRILAAATTKNAQTQAENVKLQQAREKRLSAKDIKDAEAKLEKAQLDEWQGYNKIIVDLMSTYETEEQTRITSEITALRDSIKIGDKDGKEKIDAQIAELNKQLNDPNNSIGVATLKANEFLLGLPFEVGRVILDRYEQLTPLVKAQLGGEGVALGKVKNRTVRE